MKWLFYQIFSSPKPIYFRSKLSKTLILVIFNNSLYFENANIYIKIDFSNLQLIILIFCLANKNLNFWKKKIYNIRYRYTKFLGFVVKNLAFNFQKIEKFSNYTLYWLSEIFKKHISIILHPQSHYN